MAELTDKIAVIGDATVITGFKLAGVEEVHYVADDKEGEKKLAELLDDDTLGIVIVSEKLVEACDWRLKKRIEAIAKPVVITIPDKSGPSEVGESLAKLVKRALGFDIMKK